MANIARHVPTPPQQYATGGRMTLKAVRKGRIVDHPKRVLLYGPEGIGKSTFASGAPSPIFLCPEDGTAQLDIARFPEPETWLDVVEAVSLLVRESHNYQTLVIDTADWIEPLCWAHVCKLGGKRSIEDFGYGKGYIAALDEWRALVGEIDRLRSSKSMHVVVLAHSHVKPFKNPQGDDYDRYTLKVHEKAGGFLKEWSDAVLFAQHETFAVKDGQRAKGVSTGARVVHTEREAAFDAKNRYGLPATIPLGWSEFIDAIAAVDSTKHAEALRAEIASVTAKLADAELTPKVEKAVADAADNTNTLNEILNRVQARAAKKESV